jgi:hypothetical protein
MLDQADPRTVGTGRGPTPKSRTPCDLYVCQISDAVMCHPLHIEPERSTRRSHLQLRSFR